MPDRDDATQGHALDGYWDAVFFAPSTGAAAADLDSELAATVRRVCALDAAPSADPDFASRLWEDLMCAPAATGTPRQRPDLTTAPRGRTGAPARDRAPRTSTVRGRWAFGQLATAALLVLTLVASYIVFGPSRSGRDDAGRPASSGAPSIDLGPGVLTDEILARATIGALPAKASWVGLKRRALDPGTGFAVGSDQDEGVGAYLFLVEAGAVTLRADVQATVTRAGDGALADPTPVETGIDAVLGPGDQAFFPTGVIASWRNDGATAASLLSVAYSEDRPMETTQVLVDEYRYVPPPLPVVITLRRLTLAAGAILPIADVPGLALLSVDAGQIEAVDPEGPGTPPSTVPIHAAAWGDGTLPEGRVLRILGEEPVVLLLVTLSPVGPIV